MSLYDVTYGCGHDDRVQIYGTNAHGERNRKAAWYSTIPCPECRRKARALESEENAEWARANGCAPLSGSPRQVAWAETIRARAIRGFSRIIEDKRSSGMPEGSLQAAEAALSALKARSDAGWWIDHREDTDVLLASAHA